MTCYLPEPTAQGEPKKLVKLLKEQIGSKLIKTEIVREAPAATTSNQISGASAGAQVKLIASDQRQAAALAAWAVANASDLQVIEVATNEGTWQRDQAAWSQPPPEHPATQVLVTLAAF
jgi:hypothetical protein